MGYENLTPELLRSILSYNPLTGILTWLPRPKSAFVDERAWKIWTTKYSGKRAGSECVSQRGRKYRAIGIKLNGKAVLYLEHRIAWIMMHGSLADDVQIDHINTDATDNRASNLRQADSSENQCNRIRSIVNTSGVKGVHFEKWSGRYLASITKNRKRYNLGRYDSIEEAASAYKQAALELHGQFARTE